MSQHDLVIDPNPSGIAMREEINAMALALATWSCGTSPPSTSYADQIYFNTATGLFWKRDATNTAWQRAAIIPAPVATTAAMSALDGASHPVGSVILCLANAASGDGAGGWFEARASSATVDGADVFAHNAGGALRWHRLNAIGGAGATNLSIGTHNATQLVVASDTGTDAALPLATLPGGTNLSGLFSPAEKDKLAGIEAGASSFYVGPEMVDVLAVGTVTGDGSTDDTAAINAILAGSAREIYFRKPASYYKITGPLIPLANQRLIGLGGHDLVQITGSGTPAALIRPNANYTDAAKVGVHITGFRFTGAGTNCIDLRKCTRARVRDCTFSFAAAMTGDFVHLGESWGSVLSDLRFYAEGGTAVIRLSGDSNTVGVRDIYTECETQYGVVIEQDASAGISAGPTLSGLTLQRQTEVGLWIKAGRSVTVDGLYCEKTKVPVRLGDAAGGVTNVAASCTIAGLFESGIYDTTYYTANNTGLIEAYNCVGCTIIGLQTMSVYTGSGNANTLVLLKDARNLRLAGVTRNNNQIESDLSAFVKKHASAETDLSIWIDGNGPYSAVEPAASGSNLHYKRSTSGGVVSLEEWTPATVA